MIVSHNLYKQTRSIFIIIRIILQTRTIPLFEKPNIYLSKKKEEEEVNPWRIAGN